MQIVYKKVKDLKPYEKNPRKNTKAVKYVANSIEQFGFKVPLVIDKDNVVVCGHTRLLASKKLDIEEVPCIIADDLSEEELKAFRLADNKVSEKAEWDFDLLGEEINEIFTLDMEDFGFEFVDEEKNKRDTQEKVISILNLNKAHFDGYENTMFLNCCRFMKKTLVTLQSGLVLTMCCLIKNHRVKQFTFLLTITSL